MANTNTTWKSFFTSNAQCLLYNEAGNALRDLTRTDKTVAACKSAIESNQTVPFMVLSSLNKVHVVFGMMTTGGELVSTEERAYVFLSPQGSSVDLHTIALVETLQRTHSFQGHSADTLQAADTPAKLIALENPLPTATAYESRHIFAIPPFVGAKIHGFRRTTTRSRGPHHLLEGSIGVRLLARRFESLLRLPPILELSLDDDQRFGIPSRGLHHFVLNIQRRCESMGLFLPLEVP
jgi:hypothetical protein